MNTPITKQYMALVTPEKARKLLDEYQYPYQRKISMPSVSTLVDAMMTGSFEPNTGDCIFISVTQQARYLINGQHRLRAIILSGQSYYLPIMELYTTEEHTKNIYAHTDNGKTRTYKDDPNAIDISASEGFDRSKLDILSGGTTIILRGCTDTRSKVSNEARNNINAIYASSFSRYLAAIEGATQSLQYPLRRSYVVAVALLAYRYSSFVYDAKEIDTFWTGIINQDYKSHQKDPRKLAFIHMINTTLSNRSGSGKKIISVDEGMRTLAYLLAAHLQGKQIVRVKVPDKIVLPGLPIDPEEWKR